MDEDQIVDGLPLRVWQAVFRPGMAEFAASTFVFTRESKDFVRIAFGNAGPRVDAAGAREPVYTYAVTLTPEMAVDLAGMLLKYFAEPAGQRSSSSEEL